MSLRWRLIPATLVSVALVLGFVGLSSERLLARALLQGLDESLERRIRALGATLEWRSGRLSIKPSDPAFVYFEQAGRAVLVRDESGADLLSLGSAGPTWPTTPLALPRTLAPRTVGDWRVVGVDLNPRGDGAPIVGGRIQLLAARRTSAITARVGRLRRLWMLASGAGALLAFALVYLLTRTGLSPLSRLADELESLGPDELESRLRQNGRPAELRPMVERINALVERLGSAVERERRLGANIAHELRTPVAGLRCTLEVELASGASSGDREVLEDALAMTLELEGIVARLLLLQRLESGRATVTPVAVELGAMAAELAAELSQLAGAREMTVDAGALDRTLATDRDLLRLALRNGLENALAHGERGGRVRLTAEPEQEGVVIRIENPSSAGLDRQEAGDGDSRRLLEPFEVAASARGGGHAGLGLSLASRAARALGGSVTVRRDGDRFIFELRLPEMSSQVSQGRGRVADG